MPKIPSLLLRIEVSWRLYFFLFQMMLYVLFSMSLLIYFGLNTNLAYISKLGEEDLVVYNYLFTSQREPHSVPDRDFFATLLLISSHFELLRIELFTKINFKYFNGNCDYSSCLGWSILFLYAPAHKALAFWKNYLLS